MIDPVKLEIIPNSIFNSYIRAEEDPDICEKLEIDEIQQEALDVNGISLEQIRSAPSLEEVWGSFREYVKGYSKTTNQWDAPIRAGYNIYNFDNKIIDRLCVQYGDWDYKFGAQKLFHPIHNIDVMTDIWRWTENTSMRSISMDNVRKWLGIDTDGAHNAKNDILVTAFLVIKFLNLYRYHYNFTKFTTESFKKENEIIKALMND
jgi:DNA polymerase III epsilon subunit-like protein